MNCEISLRTVVFRGTEPTELDLIEGRFELEGLRPLRLGRAYPALVGGGNTAFEQLITVPNEHAAAALSLLESTVAVDDAELERQALAAEPVERPQGRPARGRVVSEPRGQGGFAAPLVVGV